MVLGGGNVAFDCAQIARRLGAKDVSVVCLESREKMTASKDEIEEGERDGIKIYNSRTFLEVVENNGKAAGVKCQEVEGFYFDEARKLKLEIKQNSDHVLEADTVIFATGQRPEIQEEFNVPLGRGNLISTVDGVRVNDQRVYAAGDAVYGTKSVIQAIAAARRAAQIIDLDLGGTGIIDEQLSREIKLNGYLGVNKGFAETDKNSCCSDEDSACREAGRCLQCDLRLELEKPRLWANYTIK